MRSDYLNMAMPPELGGLSTFPEAAPEAAGDLETVQSMLANMDPDQLMSVRAFIDSILGAGMQGGMQGGMMTPGNEIL